MDIKEFTEKFLGVTLSNEQYRIIDNLTYFHTYNKKYYAPRNVIYKLHKVWGKHY